MSSQTIPIRNAGLIEYLREQPGNFWPAGNLGYFGYGVPTQPPPVQYFHVPISIYTSIAGTLSGDIQQIVTRLDRHEELLQDIFELVKVIEVETRRLNPDPIHDITDAAESDLNDILHTIREGRFPMPPAPVIDALLSQIIDRKMRIGQPDAPTTGEELAVG